MTSRAYIALGSSLASPWQKLSDMVRQLQCTPGLSVETTSSLYTSRSTRSGDADFCNAVVRVKTSLDPLQLLAACKAIEVRLGRTSGGPTHGPRPADLDLLMFSPALSLNHPELTVPHASMFARDFVLRPLLDVVHSDDDDLIAARARQSLAKCSQRYTTGVGCAYGPTLVGCSSQFMGIINATPDSFSDGGRFDTPMLAAARAQQLFQSGCGFVDVGGESTRPGAPRISEAEELARVVPCIEAIAKACPQLKISVDTSKPGVAREALLAGASCVNDVTAGRMGVLDVVAAHPSACVVLMHSRGDAQTMDALAAQPAQVTSELRASLALALARGIPRWRVLIDPGLGFAKSAQTSLGLLTCADTLRSDLGGGLAVVIGASRKRFIRQFGHADRASAAAAALACAHGADFIRAHDFESHREAVALGAAFRELQTSK